MVRRYIWLFLLNFITLIAHGVEPASNILGIRVGYTHAWNSTYGLSASPHEGFSIGVVDNIRLSHQYPIYIEVGCMFSNQGYAIKGYDDSNTTLNYIRIPVNINYQIPIGQSVTVQPSLGLYYAYGIWSKLHFGNDAYNVFKNGAISKNDLGLNIGANFTFQRYFFGFSYSMGLIDIAKRDIIYGDKSGMLGYRKLKNHLISLTLGLNFNL